MFVQGNDTPSFSQHLVIHEGLTNFLLDLLRVKLSILRGSVIKAIFFTVRKFELKLHTEREKRLEEENCFCWSVAQEHYPSSPPELYF